MILNCFLCSSQPDYELYKEKDHCSIYFVISRYIWHSVKTKRGTREAATEQPGLMPLKAGLLCSPPPVAPHSSQSIFHTVASKACTTCSPAGPSLTWPLSLPQPFLPHSLCSSHTSHTIAPHTHTGHIPALGALHWLFPPPGTLFPRYGSHLTFCKSLLLVEPLTTSLTTPETLSYFYVCSTDILPALPRCSTNAGEKGKNLST